MVAGNLWNLVPATHLLKQCKNTVSFRAIVGQSEYLKRFCVNQEPSFSSTVTVTVSLSKAVNPSCSSNFAQWIVKQDCSPGVSICC